MLDFLLMCFEFFKTGLFAVGGGLATVPFLKEMGVKYGWFTIEQLTTMIAISESTPGPIGINMATYVGFHLFGLLGAIGTTVSLVTPSIIVIVFVAKALQKFKQSPIVQGIFTGLRPAVVGFILSAVVSIYLLALFHMDRYEIIGISDHLFNYPAILLFIALLGFYKWQSKLHPIVVIVLAAIAGILFSL